MAAWFWRGNFSVGSQYSRVAVGGAIVTLKLREKLFAKLVFLRVCHPERSEVLYPGGTMAAPT